jgi:hypothetical protein
MSVQTGFGVNYKALQANWANDQKYFNAIGLNNIRVDIAQIPQPWAAGTPSSGGSYADVFAYWRLCAQTFTSAGFYASWGVAAPQTNNLPITSSNWSSYHDAVVAEATYLQAQNITIGDFSIGNELELQVDGTTMTTTQLFVNLRQLATDVKAVYTLSPISYGFSFFTSSQRTDWINNGLGGLDILSIHVYGNINLNTMTVGTGSYPSVAAFISAFGSKCYISEFNLDATDSNLVAFPGSLAISNMNNFLNTYIINKNINKFQLYSWVGLNNGNNRFAQLYTSGAMNPMWFDFFTSQPMFYTPRSATVSRSATPNRGATVTRGATPIRNLIFS